MKAKVLIVAIVVILIGLFFLFDLQQYLSLDYLKQQKQQFAQWHQSQPLLLSLSFFLIYVAATALALPAAVILTLAGGAIFGFWKALVIVSFASTIGATIAFLLTRYLFRDAIQTRYGERLSVLNEGVRKDGAFYVFGLRLVPLFPFFIVNSLLALTPLKASTFYWASQIGMLAGTAVYVNAGTQLASINSTADIVSLELILSFALLGIFPLLAKKTMDYLQRSKYSPEENAREEQL